MKPKKLTLDRETLAPLTPDALAHVAGAQDAGCFPQPQTTTVASRIIGCPEPMSRDVLARCPQGPLTQTRKFHCPQDPFTGGGTLR